MATNKVNRLASASKTNMDALNIKNTRKDEFEAIRNLMLNNLPEMGREIIVSTELYDSNILKGDQISKVRPKKEEKEEKEKE